MVVDIVPFLEQELLIAIRTPSGLRRVVLRSPKAGVGSRCDRATTAACERADGPQALHDRRSIGDRTLAAPGPRLLGRHTASSLRPRAWAGRFDKSLDGLGS
jgi:hypothetical protein